MAKTPGKLKKALMISYKWHLGGEFHLSYWLDWTKYNSGGFALAGQDLRQQIGEQV